MVLILSFVITYLVAYKNNNSEVVKFMSNVKLNLDGQYYLYNDDCTELIEEVQLVCKGEGKIVNKGESDYQGRVNLVSKKISTFDYKNCNMIFQTSDNYIWVYMISKAIKENEDGTVAPETGNYHIEMYINQDNLSDYYIEISQEESEEKYIITNVGDIKEAQKKINSIKR